MFCFSTVLWVPNVYRMRKKTDTIRNILILKTNQILFNIKLILEMWMFLCQSHFKAALCNVVFLVDRFFFTVVLDSVVQVLEGLRFFFCTLN